MAYQQFTVRSGQPEQTVDFAAGGGTVTVTGGTVFYRDQPGVTAATADGSIANGGSATLFGTQFFSTAASRVDGQVRLPVAGTSDVFVNVSHVATLNVTTPVVPGDIGAATAAALTSEISRAQAAEALLNPPAYYLNGGVNLRESVPRPAGVSDTPTALTSGVMTLVAIVLYAGDVITSLTFRSHTTAAGTPTNWWFALYNPSFNLLSQTADQTTGAWPANSARTRALGAPQSITVTGVYYAAIMVTATTVPSLTCLSTTSGMNQAGAVIASQKLVAGTFGTALTTTAPASAATPTSIGPHPLRGGELVALAVRSSATVAGAGTTATVPVPAGAVAGDKNVAAIVHDNTQIAVSNWGLTGGAFGADDTLHVIDYLGSPADGPWTVSFLQSGVAASVKYAIVVVAIPANPSIALAMSPTVDVIVTAATTSSTAPAPCPNVTPLTDNDLILSIVGWGRGTTFTPPGGVTEAAEVRTGNGSTDRTAWVGSAAITGGAGVPVTGAAVTNDNPFAQAPGNYVTASVALKSTALPPGGSGTSRPVTCRSSPTCRSLTRHASRSSATPLGRARSTAGSRRSTATCTRSPRQRTRARRLSHRGCCSPAMSASSRGRHGSR